MHQSSIDPFWDYPIGWVGDQAQDACEQLNTYLSALGNHLETVRAQYRLQADQLHEKRLKELDPSKDRSADYESRREAEYIYQVEKKLYEDQKEKEDIFILQMAWNSFIVSCWATFEMYFEQFDGYVKKEKNIELAPNKLRGKTVPRLRIYFSEDLKVPISVEAIDLEYLEKLYLVRNAVAHGNGIIDEVYKDRRQKLRDFIAENSNITLDGRYLSFGEPFCREALSIMSRVLKNINNSVRAELGYFQLQ